MFPVRHSNQRLFEHIYLLFSIQDNVGRVIIDGVVDSENYYEGLLLDS